MVEAARNITAAPHTVGGTSNRWVQPALGLLALVLAAYVPAFRAGFIWDDNEYLTENATVLSPQGLWRIWADPTANSQYYPLCFTSYWLECRLWGLWAPGYHIVNVLLHAAAAVLAWRALLRLGVPGAWVAAALWAVHPVNVESVAWVAERKNTLSAVFYLLALLAYLRYRPLDEPPPGIDVRRRMYGLALLAFSAALLSKTFSATWPAVVLVLQWWRRGRVTWRDVWCLLPFFALSAGAAWLTHFVEQAGVAARSAAVLPMLTGVERLMLAGRVLAFYAEKVLLPVGLIHVYPRWPLDTGAGWQWAWSAAVPLVLVTLWLLRRRLGRGPLAAALIFAGSLAPVLGFVNFGYMQFSFVADHFVYLPALALIAIVVGGVQTLVLRARVRLAAPRSAYASGCAAGLVIAALTVMSIRQARIYQDSGTLWRDTLAKDPQSWTAAFGVGTHLLKTGHAAEAPAYFERALLTAPQPLPIRLNLAQAYEEMGRDAAALELITALAREHPHSVPVRLTLGTFYLRRQRAVEATEQFIEVLRSNPAVPDARRFVAQLAGARTEALLVAGRLNEAATYLRGLVKAVPDLREPHELLARVAGQLGNTQESAQEAAAAAKLAPAPGGH